MCDYSNDSEKLISYSSVPNVCVRGYNPKWVIIQLKAIKAFPPMVLFQTSHSMDETLHFYKHYGGIITIINTNVNYDFLFSVWIKF